MLDKSEKGWPYSTIENAKVILENDELFKDNMNITKNFFIFCCRTLFPLLQSPVSFWKEIFT